MNNTRRKQIEEIESKITELLVQIDEVLEAENAAYDNLPESLQAGPQGDAMQEAVDALQTAHDDLENITTTLEEARA